MKNIKIDKPDGAVSKGVHIISICDASSEKAQSLQDKISLASKNWMLARKMQDKSMLKAFNDEYNYWLEKLHQIFLVDQLYVENITTTVGRSVLAQRLAGTTTYSGTVNYGALGTDATSAIVGDTTLGTETYRKALSSGTFSSNVAYLENFYTASEVNGTFEEFGFFIDGTGSADTGQLFNRFTQSVTKSATETLNVQSQVTFNDA